MNKLPLEFYLQEDVVELSRSLLGKCLFTNIGGVVTGGRIIETEAYRGPDDRACHAYQNRRTPRTEVMFHKGGICYVYLCYGMHHLLNIVTNREGIPHAILVRAIEPLIGMEKMLQRRNKKAPEASLTAGPGSVTQALGINRSFNGVSLRGNQIWIEKTDACIPNENIFCSPRIGIDYAGEDALLPWRFRMKTEKNI